MKKALVLGLLAILRFSNAGGVIEVGGQVFDGSDTQFGFICPESDDSCTDHVHPSETSSDFDNQFGFICPHSDASCTDHDHPSETSTDFDFDDEFGFICPESDESCTDNPW